jgi:hypothetical protein
MRRRVRRPPHGAGVLGSGCRTPTRVSAARSPSQIARRCRRDSRRRAGRQLADDPEREVLLEFSAAGAEHHQPGVRGEPSRLGQEARLADSGRRSMTTNRPLPPAAAPAAEASAVRSRSRSSSRARGRSSPREAPATAVAHYGEAGRRRSGGTGSMCRATVPRALGAAGEPREGSERERAVRGLIAVVLNDVPIDVLANRSGQAQVDVVCFNVMVHRPHRLAGIIVTCSRTRASTTSRCVTSG